ncbi:MAG: Rrf2 family transcriptional regulator [Deltaproteobacteria bacterium]|nr:MAG: Rrf2 family transcriptional regulator [Deltaproteobacteria bacterium]
MRLSKKLEYAIRALIYMASKGRGRTFLIRDIASNNEIPKKFLELILLDLKNAGILTSKRGVSGGYAFLRDPSEITLLEVFRAIEGELDPTECMREMKEKCEGQADPSWCALKAVMEDMKRTVEEMLSRWTIEKIVALEKELKARSAENLMFYI